MQQQSKIMSNSPPHPIFIKRRIPRALGMALAKLYRDTHTKYHIMQHYDLQRLIHFWGCPEPACLATARAPAL